MTKKESTFWGSEWDEHLTHTEMDEAIESILDCRGDLSGDLVICGYAPMDKPTAESLCDHVLEHLLETLDEDYGNPEGYTDPSDDMKEAAKVFIVGVLEDYTVSCCEEVERKTIDVADWVKENRPDWLNNNRATAKKK